ncbi:MAG: hypothetical protein WBI20_05785 [Burkholderiaceae bacterium]
MATQLGKQVVDAIRAAGLHLVLAPDLTLKVSPASTLTPELRVLIRVNKTALINSLRQEAANDVTDPDRWCWPHSPAMTGTEIDTFIRLMAKLTGQGMTTEAAERLADEQVLQERAGGSDRPVLTMEKQHERN